MTHFETEIARSEFWAEVVAASAAAREARMIETMARAEQAKTAGDAATAHALLQMACFEDDD